MLKFSVKCVVLDRNQLKKWYPNYAKATVFALDQHAITFIQNDTFTSLHQVEHLWLDFNNLTSLTPCLFNDLTNLVELTLGSNNINRLNSSQTFTGLVKLRMLYLDDNHLTQIDGNLLVIN